MEAWWPKSKVLMTWMTKNDGMDTEILLINNKSHLNRGSEQLRCSK